MSDDIIDLRSEREKRDGPDAEHVHVAFEDGKAVKYFEFTCSYRTLDLREWGFTIWATSFEDAQQRITALKTNAKVDGRIAEGERE